VPAGRSSWRPAPNRSAPPIPGLADVPYWTNRDAVEAKRCPGSLIVPGGGAVGAELAQVFARVGVTVTVVEATDGLLPPEEPEAGNCCTTCSRARTFAVYTAAKTTKVHHDDGVFRVEMDDGNTVTAEQLLVATGRRADIASIGAGAIGVDEHVRAPPVDEGMGSPTVEARLTRLRDEGRIGEETCRRLERGIDLEEARLADTPDPL